MKKQRIIILLIEDNSDDIVYFDNGITEINNSSFYSHEFVIIHAMSISEARDYLETDTADAILLNLMISDFPTVDKLFEAYEVFKKIPIIIMTNINNYDIAMNAIKLGVQDLLIKGETTYDLLYRSVIYSIERFRMKSDSSSNNFIDELTGLYNKEGLFDFFPHAEGIVRRRKSDLTIIYLNYDNLKSVNSQFGVKEGDNILKAFASIIKTTFRESDFFARLDKDNFVVISLDAAEWADESIIKRLERHFSNARNTFSLSENFNASFGLFRSTVENPLSIEQLLSKSKEKMLEYRRNKKS